MQIMTPDQQCKKLAKQVAKVSAQHGAPLTLGDKGITSDTNGYLISYAEFDRYARIGMSNLLLSKTDHLGMAGDDKLIARAYLENSLSDRTYLSYRLAAWVWLGLNSCDQLTEPKTYLTVQELIEHLSQMNPQSPVYLRNIDTLDEHSITALYDSARDSGIETNPVYLDFKETGF